MSLLTTRNTYVYKNIRLYFCFRRWYLCWAEKQSQRVHAHEGVVGRRKSQWTTDFSRNSGTYIVYNSHVTSSNSSFSLTMVTPTSHFFAFHWLLAQARFCGRAHLPPSPNLTTPTVQVIFRYLRPDAPVFNIHRIHRTSVYGDISAITLLILSLSGCSCVNIFWYTAPLDMMTFRWSYRSYQSMCQQHPPYSHLQATLIFYTSPSQSGPESNINEEVLHNSKFLDRSLTMWWFNVQSRTLVLFCSKTQSVYYTP